MAGRAPSVLGRGVAEDDAVVLRELRGCPRLAPPFEVARASHDREGRVHQLVGDDGEVGELAGVDSDIVALLDDIDVAAREADVHPDLGALEKELVDQTHGDAVLEEGSRPDPTLRGALGLGEDALGLLELGEDADAPFVVELACVGEAQLPRGPLNQSDAELRLEPGDTTASGRGGQTQSSARCSRASRLSIAPISPRKLRRRLQYPSQIVPNQSKLMLHSRRIERRSGTRRSLRGKRRPPRSSQLFFMCADTEIHTTPGILSP